MSIPPRTRDTVGLRMLFNSPEFLFAFLPLVLVGSLVAWRWFGANVWIAWLCVSSILFYGWWRAAYLPLLIGSILFNFWVAKAIAARRSEDRATKPLFIAGLAGNLGLLGVFKYLGLAVETLNGAFGVGLDVPAITLPIGISFFTFQAIAYLADVHAGERPESRLLHFATFISFFPQLIAGPIIHPRQLLPQFDDLEARRPNATRLAVGTTVFAIGLFKKVVIADRIAPIASSVFDAAAGGVVPTAAEAWFGTFAYTFQIYFDFSGYSDMAIGLGTLFGLRLPLNFDSPYKSENMIDFWRRWHMTLSQFLRDYLYIPLGGNRRGSVRRYLNLMITMLLGGLWHGASWTFLAWGGLHGLYLVVNHGWRHLRGAPREDRGLGVRMAGRALTFLAAAAAWVPFRAADFETAGRMFGAMARLPMTLASADPFPHDLVSDPEESGVFLVLLLLTVWFWPNTQNLVRKEGWFLGELFSRGRGTPELVWRPSTAWAVIVGACLSLSVLSLSRVSEFIYFTF